MAKKGTDTKLALVGSIEERRKAFESKGWAFYPNGENGFRGAKQFPGDAEPTIVEMFNRNDVFDRIHDIEFERQQKPAEMGDDERAEIAEFFADPESASDPVDDIINAKFSDADDTTGIIGHYAMLGWRIFQTETEFPWNGVKYEGSPGIVALNRYETLDDLTDAIDEYEKSVEGQRFGTLEDVKSHFEPKGWQIGPDENGYKATKIYDGGSVDIGQIPTLEQLVNEMEAIDNPAVPMVVEAAPTGWIQVSNQAELDKCAEFLTEHPVDIKHAFFWEGKPYCITYVEYLNDSDAALVSQAGGYLMIAEVDITPEDFPDVEFELEALGEFHSCMVTLNDTTYQLKGPEISFMLNVPEVETPDYFTDEERVIVAEYAGYEWSIRKDEFSHFSAAKQPEDILEYQQYTDLSALIADLDARDKVRNYDRKVPGQKKTAPREDHKTIVFKELRCNLSDRDVAARNLDYHETITAIETTTSAFISQKKEYEKKVGELRSKAEQLRQAAMTRQENRDVPCEQLVIWHLGTVQIWRQDTNELVSERGFNEQERQGNLY